jgi:hypothetical protein
VLRFLIILYALRALILPITHQHIPVGLEIVLRHAKAARIGDAFHLYLEYPISFWRNKSGLEVDFIPGSGEVAIEVKGSSRMEDRDLRPLAAFLVCNEARAASL